MRGTITGNLKLRRTYQPCKNKIAQALELWVNNPDFTAKDIAEIIGTHEVSVNTWITKHYMFKPERGNVVLCIMSKV